ncbi:hypothetical protein CGCVW01_v001807 [Colletotrichum viniferum]|nr:hypothetical protein CGCVW01_v001807 [Colletotrichum viniferum]
MSRRMERRVSTRARFVPTPSLPALPANVYRANWDHGPTAPLHYEAYLQATDMWGGGDVLDRNATGTVGQRHRRRELINDDHV